MAFPNNVKGWIVGKNDGSSTSKGYFVGVGSSPEGQHRIAYEEIADNGDTLTYRIYHQICLGLTSHIQLGYSVKYTYTINGASKELYAKDGDTVWNSGPNGDPASQSAVLHYYNLNVNSSAYGYKLHSYTDSDRYGSSSSKVWFQIDITFKKTESGKVNFSMSWSNGKRSSGGTNLGAPSALKLNVASFEIDTGKTSYKAPSYSISDISPDFGVINSTSRKVTYKISGGTNALSWTNVRIYDSNDKYLGDYDLNTTQKGDNLSKNFIPKTPICTDGQQYKGSIRFNDKKSTYETGKSSFYTYRTPIIQNFNLTNTSFSGNGNTQLSWYTNGRRWSTSSEKDFKTYIKFGSKSWFTSTNNNPNNGSSSNAVELQTQNLSSSIINNQFTAEERSKESISTTIQIKRRNESSEIEAISGTKNINIQFFPKYAVSRMAFYVYDKSIADGAGASITAGSIVYVSDIPQILLRWIYPDTVDRGVINGYIVRIYDDSSYSNLIKTYTVQTSNSIATQIINTKTDLKRGVLNYIKITPYYIKPIDNSKQEGPELKSSFIIPLGKLATPIISYPINNTTWHNNKFRVLFQLPIDDDYDTYSDDIKNGYRYKNIEIKINDKIYAFTNNTENMSSNAIINSNIFSTSTLSYNKKLVINPSIITDFINTSKYTISVRVQKNYYKPIWSNWSNIVILNNTAINRLTINKGDNILITQYNTMRNYSKRLYDVYPISSLNVDNKSLNKGDIIFYRNYNAIYNTIRGIQMDVNNYASFDSNRQNVKFAQIINEFAPPNEPTQDIITALDNLKPSIQGRNYINLLIECMNKLI